MGEEKKIKPQPQELEFKFEGEKAEKAFSALITYLSSNSKNWNNDDVSNVINAHNKNVKDIQTKVDEWVNEHENDGKWYMPEFNFIPDVSTKITAYTVTGGMRKLLTKMLKLVETAVARASTGPGELIDLDEIFVKPAKGVMRIHVKYDVSRGDLYKMSTELKKKLTIKVDGNIDFKCLTELNLNLEDADVA